MKPCLSSVRGAATGAFWPGVIVAVAFSIAACAPAHGVMAPSVPALAEPPGPIHHVVVVTIDGLVPDSYVHPEAHGLSISTLRSVVAHGASSDGALSVFPSVTYPAHTSIASGVVPLRHGIFTNAAFDPLGKNQNGWRWYAEDVKVPRLWDVANAAGYRTALIDWPVTVGAQATFHVPEVWRAKVSDDLKLIRALSTRGLFEAVAKQDPDFNTGFRPQDVSDEAGTDLASYVIANGKPHLLFLHIWQVDAMQHKYGLWSKEALAAIETADRQIGRLLQVIDQTGLARDTALVIASDHGFANVTRCVNPAALLHQAGLIQIDDHDQVTEWDATVLSSSGNAYVYLNHPDDAALRAKTLAIFETAKQGGKSGIGRIYDHSEIVTAGGDPDAFLALEPELGTYFGPGHGDYETPPQYKAVHGYDPTRPEMKASLLLFGPNIQHGKILDARLIDIAPTVASWLSLKLPHVDGQPLRIVADSTVKAEH